MLSKRDNELLTRVGPGAPMGQLMRRYWHPIAGSAELDASPFRTKEVRLLGEDLVLYRDRAGRLGLIDRWCSHRRVNLAYGVVEEDGLRCQYHGWKFDHTGACVEQPFEETVHPDGRFKGKCGIAGYGVEELAGLIFAYLGPQPAPLLPRWEPLVWDNVVRDIAVTELPCNWLQCQENSVDPTHSEWLHGYFGSYVRTLPGRGGQPVPNQIPRIGRRHQKIGFDVFDYGIIKRRVQEGGSEEDEDWHMGIPSSSPIFCSWAISSLPLCSSESPSMTPTRFTCRSTFSGPPRGPKRRVRPACRCAWCRCSMKRGVGWSITRLTRTTWRGRSRGPSLNGIVKSWAKATRESFSTAGCCGSNSRQ